MTRKMTTLKDEWDEFCATVQPDFSVVPEETCRSMFYDGAERVVTFLEQSVCEDNEVRQFLAVNALVGIGIVRDIDLVWLFIEGGTEIDDNSVFCFDEVPTCGDRRDPNKFSLFLAGALAMTAVIAGTITSRSVTNITATLNEFKREFNWTVH